MYIYIYIYIYSSYVLAAGMFRKGHIERLAQNKSMAAIGSGGGATNANTQAVFERTPDREYTDINGRTENGGDEPSPPPFSVHPHASNINTPAI